jgi:ADP-ribose pyrophosphatase YjhB (NUDIX family)
MHGQFSINRRVGAMVLYHNGHVLMERREEEALRGLFAFPGGKEECCDDGHLHHTAQREIREELHVDAEAAVDSAEDFRGDYFVRTYLARRPVTTPDYLRLRQRNMLGHVLQWFSLSEVRELVRRDQVTPSSLPIVGSSRFESTVAGAGRYHLRMAGLHPRDQAAGVEIGGGSLRAGGGSRGRRGGGGVRGSQSASKRHRTADA